LHQQPGAALLRRLVEGPCGEDLAGDEQQELRQIPSDAHWRQWAGSGNDFLPELQLDARDLVVAHVAREHQAQECRPEIVIPGQRFDARIEHGADIGFERVAFIEHSRTLLILLPAQVEQQLGNDVLFGLEVVVGM
ncbi:hypothetical protein BZG21_41555, partial [Escherichia coli]|nr:hypothetical protein [Escherichia coli]